METPKEGWNSSKTDLNKFNDPIRRKSSLRLSQISSETKLLISRKMTTKNLPSLSKDLRSQFKNSDFKTLRPSSCQSSRKASTYRKHGDSSVVSRSKTLFNVKDECKKEYRTTYKQMLFGNNPSSIDFYKKIEFDPDEFINQDFQKMDQLFTQKAKKKWSFISNQILCEDKNRFRTFLNTVNDKLYSKVNKLGELYYYHELADKDEKMELQSQSKKRDIKDVKRTIVRSRYDSKHLSDGLKLLKSKVSSQVLDQSQGKSTVGMKHSRPGISKNYARQESLISPLLKISRGIKEEKLKKKARRFSLYGKMTKHTPFSSFVDPNNIENTYKNIRFKQVRRKKRNMRRNSQPSKVKARINEPILIRPVSMNKKERSVNLLSSTKCSSFAPTDASGRISVKSKFHKSNISKHRSVNEHNTTHKH